MYATELLRYIDNPGTPGETMLKRVPAAVEAQSKGHQEPSTLRISVLYRFEAENFAHLRFI